MSSWVFSQSRKPLLLHIHGHVGRRLARNIKGGHFSPCWSAAAVAASRRCGSLLPDLNDNPKFFVRLTFFISKNHKTYHQLLIWAYFLSLWQKHTQIKGNLKTDFIFSWRIFVVKQFLKKITLSKGCHCDSTLSVLIEFLILEFEGYSNRTIFI